MTKNYLERGNYKFNQGKYFSAITSYQKAVTKTPNSFEIHYKKGLAEMKVQLYSDALESLTKASAIKPNIADIHYRKAFLYQKFGKYDLAKTSQELAEKLAEEEPQSEPLATSDKISNPHDKSDRTDNSSTEPNSQSTSGSRASGLLQFIVLIFAFTRMIIMLSMLIEEFSPSADSTYLNSSENGSVVSAQSDTISNPLSNLATANLLDDIKIVDTGSLDDYYITDAYIDPDVILQNVASEDGDSPSKTRIDFDGKKYATESEPAIYHKHNLYITPAIDELPEGTKIKIVELIAKPKSLFDVPAFYRHNPAIMRQLTILGNKKFFLSYYDHQGKEITLPTYLQRFNRAIVLDFDLLLNPETGRMRIYLFIPDIPEIAEVRLSK